MPHQPLGASTVGIMAGGRKPESDPKLLDKALHEQQIALHDAASLLADLMDSPGVLTVARELEGLINNFLKTNEQAALLVKIIASWRNILDVVPRMATEKVNKLLGPQLRAVKEHEETQVAP